ncbi:hypothetical protein [Stenotrophomonas sp. TWI1183]|uniref:hypothetical protein n=1 Tax=Stenotrophomonas sp. TWI1183 TaxID=3136799 RepID=UPI00320ABCE1
MNVRTVLSYKPIMQTFLRGCLYLDRPSVIVLATPRISGNAEPIATVAKPPIPQNPYSDSCGGIAEEVVNDCVVGVWINNE